jgi:hypothetical protein
MAMKVSPNAIRDACFQSIAASPSGIPHGGGEMNALSSNRRLFAGEA